jgi:uncharacterized lipoprotein YmbA
MFRVLPVVSMLLLAACASAPTQEMSDARQAVRAARDAGAERHAPVTLQDAESKLDSAGMALHSHDYRQARKNAVAAKTSAINAQDMAYAIGSATAAVDKARQHGVLSREAEELLNKAHRVASEGDVQMAVRLANEAKNLAEQDLRLN